MGTKEEGIGISFRDPQFDQPERWQFIRATPHTDYPVAVALQNAGQTYELQLQSSQGLRTRLFEPGEGASGN